MYSIVELANGKFQGRYQIQDGVENFIEESKKRAIKKMISAAKTMNGVIITEDDIVMDNVPNRNSNFEQIILRIENEFHRATNLHGSFNSTHEGYAIIQEEVDELWDGVKANHDRVLLKEEAIQIAAMAIRFCVDL